MKKKDRIAGKAKKAGVSVDEFKHNRKEKLKQGLADAFGGGERGLLTQKSDFQAKKEGMEMEAQDDSKKAIADGVKDVVSSGGGQSVSTPTPDRTDMTSNFSGAFFRKKGY